MPWYNSRQTVIETSVERFLGVPSQMDYDQILPNLYVGSHPGTADDIGELKSTGITAVLNVQSDDDCQYLGICWSELQADYEAAGVGLCRVPIQDFDGADLRDKLPAAVEELKRLLDGGHTVFVHCSSGINRSPCVVICYLNWVAGRELEDAAQYVRGCRACDPVMEVVRQATEDRENGI